MRDTQIVGVHDHLVAMLESRVGGRVDGSRHVDPGNGRVLAHDLAGALVGKCILVVDRRILGFDHHVAGVELVDRHLDEAAGHVAVVLKSTVCLELLHWTLLLRFPQLFSVSRQFPSAYLSFHPLRGQDTTSATDVPSPA